MRTTSDSGFAAVSAACSLLSSLTVPYWIIGGWAIDLAVGRVTRDHADVDVMLLERDKHALWSDLTGVDVEPAGTLGPGRLVLHSEREDVLPEVLSLRRRLVGVRRVLGPWAWSRCCDCATGSDQPQAAWACAVASSMNACASQQASALNASSSSSEESSAAVASRTLAPPVSTTRASGARSHSQAITAGVSAARACTSSHPAAMRTSYSSTTRRRS